MSSRIDASNPLGILSIDHLEFTCDHLNSKIKKLFYTFGFQKTYENQKKSSELFSQGQVKFLLTANTDKSTPSRKYFENHGEGISKISFLVEDCKYALEEAISRGAELKKDLEVISNNHGDFKTASIQGFGDVLNEFVERPSSYFRPDYTQLPKDENSTPLKHRVARIDHLTNNVPYQEMDRWVDFYQKIYGFKVTRYFDIKGNKTGLLSKVVQLPKGEIIIPINEPESKNGKSQIQEFLDEHKGAGVQHIALTCSNILSTVKELRERNVNFLNIPHTYYEDIPQRNFKIKEKLSDLEERQLLVDGDEKGYLIQNFTETYVGPLFFEFIQRKKHDGFGEGNFQALFNAIERNQIKRGYLKE